VLAEVGGWDGGSVGSFTVDSCFGVGFSTGPLVEVSGGILGHAMMESGGVGTFTVGEGGSGSGYGSASSSTPMGGSPTLDVEGEPPLIVVPFSFTPDPPAKPSLLASAVFPPPKPGMPPEPVAPPGAEALGPAPTAAKAEVQERVVSFAPALPAGDFEWDERSPFFCSLSLLAPPMWWAMEEDLWWAMEVEGEEVGVEEEVG